MPYFTQIRINRFFKLYSCGYGRNNYRGPKPPFNWPHLYQFNVYALDCLLDLPGKSRKRDVLAAMQGHILQEGCLVGRFR
ncbi:MAG: hypothetical protein LBS02_04210 [Hungatella sp.]|nr:hypothetical protein [Hungatella sp.]